MVKFRDLLLIAALAVVYPHHLHSFVVQPLQLTMRTNQKIRF
jgi:hypothetical protein